MEHNDRGWVQFSRVHSGTGGYTKTLPAQEISGSNQGYAGGTYEWNVAHTVNHNALMLGSVFRNSTQMGFEDVISVEIWHLSIRLYPNLSPIESR